MKDFEIGRLAGLDWTEGDVTTGKRSEIHNTVDFQGEGKGSGAKECG